MNILEVVGAPSAGTNEVQTITFGGTITGGVFRLRARGKLTSNIAWSATNNTLRDNIDAALEMVGAIGTGGVTTAVGTMVAGIGTITVTFEGGNAKRNVGEMTVVSALTGTSPTVAVTTTTPGVEATERLAVTSQLLLDTENSILYINTSSTPLQPTWTRLGPPA